MRCSSCEPLLDPYLEGSVRPRQAFMVAAHLRGCPACTALLHELRVVDALLATARSPGVGADFTASVVSKTPATQPNSPRRVPIWLALFLYLCVAWALAALAAFRSNDLAGAGGVLVGVVARYVAALGAAVQAVAPATPLAAAAVSAVLLLDLLLLVALFYGYRRVRPLIALHLSRGPRR